MARVNIELTDEGGQVIGLEEKYKVHRVPVLLHRAISIVIYNKDKSEMLITKRSVKKSTWPYFWSNAVCSHPHPKETYQKAAERRLYEELGFRTPLKEIFKFIYEAKMDNGVWGEHEYDVVFVGKCDCRIRPDPKEIAGYEWLKIGDLEKDLKCNPKKYTPWLKMILEKLKI